MNDDVFQMVAMQIAIMVSAGELNQICGSPPKRRMTSLTMPYSL